MSDQNGTPVQQKTEVRFRNPQSMMAFFILDGAVGAMNTAVGQLEAIGRFDLAQALSAKSLELGAARDEVVRKEQSGIVVAGPGDLPPAGRA